MKKLVLILVWVAFGFSALLLAPEKSALAQGPIEPAIFNLNNDTIYQYLDNPSNLFAQGDQLFVILNGKVNVYKNFVLTDVLSISAEKFAIYQDTYVYLFDGQFHFGEIILSDVSDFSLYDSTLFISSGSQITKYDLITDPQLQNGVSYNIANEVLALSQNGDYYFVDEGTNFEAHTIYRLDNGNNYLVDELPNKITSLYALEDKLYCLSMDKLICYNKNDGIYVATSQFTVNAKNFCVASEKIYVLTNLSGIIEIDLDFLNERTLMASASEEDYFYNKPSSVLARFSTLIVSDRINDRLAVIDSKGDISYISLSRPLASSIDWEGNVYAVTQSAIIKFSPSGEKLKEVGINGASDILIDSNDNIYVLTTRGIVLVDSDLNFSEVVINAQSMCLFNGKLSYYDGQDVYLNGVSVFSAQNLFSYAIDANKNIFYTKADGFYRYDGVETKLSSVSGKLVISGIKTDYLNYGDALIVDSDKHCVFKFNQTDIGSGDIENLYYIPDISTLTQPSIINKNIIAKTLKDVKLFKTPTEAEVCAKIPKDANVIIYYDAICPEEYVYVLYDDVNTSSLVGGYVYSSFISEPLGYELPDISVGIINSNNTRIYKWPSIKSPLLMEAKNKNDTVSIIPFVTNFIDEYGKKWYQDGFAKKWYRIKIDDAHEGFVLATDISSEFFTNQKMPNTNAVITDYALVYHYDSITKKYTPIDDLWVAKGTRVRVETPFDSSQKYSKIVFYRDGYGTINIDCYVETKYVNYDGVDLVQFVAIVIIIVTLLLAGVIIYRRAKSKRRNRTNFS